jgi:hypothetical protein
MDWHDLEKHFSAARLGRYRAACNGDESKAASAYVHNLLLAEATMPMLNVIEIALKNGVHYRLTALYQRTDWWEAWTNDPSFAWQAREVGNAKAKLLRRAEAVTPDKIIAELAFGFWSSLFNVQFQPILWKDLRLVFPRCPKTAAPAPYRLIRTEPDPGAAEPRFPSRAIALAEPCPDRFTRERYRSHRLA